MKSYYKNEVADMAGVSIRTFRRWLHRHADTLASLGCRPRDKFINPRALQWLSQEYCIEVE